MAQVKKYQLSTVAQQPIEGAVTILVPAGERWELCDDLYATSLEVRCHLEQDAVLHYRCLVRDKTFSPTQRIDRVIIFSLVGNGSEAHLNWGMEVWDATQYRLTTRQHHCAQATTSAVCVRSVLHDGAKLWCNNLIRIERTGQRSKAREENKNILIGDTARVVSIPKLEVEANDVEASHGSASSRLDENQLWYLGSRGLERSVAQQILIDGFLGLFQY